MGSPLIPSIRYNDAPKAVQWLCGAFGFVEHFVAPDGEGGIAHAQLVLGDSMLMLGSAREDDFGQLQKPLEDPEGTVSQSLYVVVGNVDAHYENALSHGAIIVKEPEDQGYGGRLYTCRDPEGNLWSFVSYDLWLPVRADV